NVAAAAELEAVEHVEGAGDRHRAVVGDPACDHVAVAGDRARRPVAAAGDPLASAVRGVCGDVERVAGEPEAAALDVSTLDHDPPGGGLVGTGGEPTGQVNAVAAAVQGADVGQHPAAEVEVEPVGVGVDHVDVGHLES